MQGVKAQFVYFPRCCSAAELDTFVRKKYINKDWADQEACWPPTEEYEDDEIRFVHS